MTVVQNKLKNRYTESVQQNKELFQHLRIKYLAKNLPSSLHKIIDNCDIQLHLENVIDSDHSQIKNKSLNWGNTSFHLKYRIRELSDLLKLVPEMQLKKNEIDRIIRGGYILSILPLNLLLPTEVLRQFLPPIDFAQPHPLKDIDPYGITSSKLVKNDIWFASQKFDHTVLMNIHGHCPIGCSDCYKSFYVRERGHENDLGAGNPFEEQPSNLEKQTKILVNWLNSNPQVYDVIISGGEPLIRPNSHLKVMLRVFEKAKFLKVLRICTGTIFLGLPFRIDDELLNILEEFSDKTGVRITFQAHLSNHFQITPEAIIAVHKIRKKGFSIYSQTPIKEGVNFFSHDIEKTKNFWIELSKLQFMVGVDPYKFIIDMHPRTLSYYVPIELIIKVWSDVYESHNFPELERPKTISILCKEGNIQLSGHSLFSIHKEVDIKSKIVTYYIPTLFREKPFVYQEPLSEFNKDSKSLDTLKRKRQRK